MGTVILPFRHVDLAAKLRFLQSAGGAVPSPYDCWLAHRVAKTLHLRMKEHGTNALTLANPLQRSPHVEEVIYSGLTPDQRDNVAYANLSPHVCKFVDEERDSDGGFPCGGMKISYTLLNRRSKWQFSRCN